MEILGSSIPNLQASIASGLEAVTSGITQTSNVGGPSALGIAQQSFSSLDLGAASALDLPMIGSPGDYPSLKDYYFSDAALANVDQSPIPSSEIKKTLIDPNFRLDASLSDFVTEPPWWNKYHPVSPGTRLNQKTDQLGFPDELGDEYGAYLDRMISEPANSDTLKQIFTRADEEKNRPGIPINGSSDRSSMIAGASTQSIDDSLLQLQQTPAPDTANLFTQQLGAVQDMFSTIDSTVQLQKSLSSNLLLGGLRG